MPPPGRRVGTDLPILRPGVQDEPDGVELQHAEIDHVAAQQHDIVGVAQEPLIDLPFSKLLPPDTRRLRCRSRAKAHPAPPGWPDTCRSGPVA